MFQSLDPCKRDQQAFAIAGKVSGSHNSSYEKTMVEYKASRWPLSLHTWVEDHGARRGIGCAMEAAAPFEFLRTYVQILPVTNRDYNKNAGLEKMGYELRKNRTIDTFCWK